MPPVEVPVAPARNPIDVLLFVELVFICDHGAVRLPVSAPARDVQSPAAVSVMVFDATGAVIEDSADEPPPPPPATHVHTAGFAAVQERKVLLPDGCATGRLIV